MKKIAVYISVFLLLASCSTKETKNEVGENAQPKTELTEKTEEVEETAAAPLMDPRTYGGEKSENQVFIDGNKVAEGGEFGELGYWVGDFGDNMININLYEIKDGKANGYSVCAGNFRKITGNVTKDGDVLAFDMEEPGDDKYDGHFKFTIDITGQVLNGTWEPFDKTATKSKEYELKKREFKYDPTVGDYPEASERELSNVDLENQTEMGLGFMRNEIYARHGYSFKNKDYRHYFESKDWYMPIGVDIRDKLSDVEVNNIELIYEYESYYEDYYDDYGR